MSKLTKQQQAEAQWAECAEQPAGAICPVRTTLNVLGGKWKLLILSYLLDGPRRYGELRRLVPEVTEKMLIQELRELEADAIIQRLVYQQVPPKVEYQLTEHGRRVQPMFQELINWGTGYLGREGSGVAATATLAAGSLQA
ncbi:winged helix-turn-helix transcriptional regulator [Hymenobacter koreensis]|uniref:HTH hxlR-type domain-containing protein n=1 Tax=Hymenobacter koreensis TaxID=1084523 RepID=A0ABP8IXI6_9BACT